MVGPGGGYRVTVVGGASGGCRPPAAPWGAGWTVGSMATAARSVLRDTALRGHPPSCRGLHRCSTRQHVRHVISTNVSGRVGERQLAPEDSSRTVGRGCEDPTEAFVAEAALRLAGGQGCVRLLRPTAGCRPAPTRTSGWPVTSRRACGEGGQAAQLVGFSMIIGRFCRAAHGIFNRDRDRDGS